MSRTCLRGRGVRLSLCPLRRSTPRQRAFDARTARLASIRVYDAHVPRTTLQLADDAMKVARAHAARHRLTLGQAVSELVRQAAERPLVTAERGGLRVVRLGRRSPQVTTALIDRLREDLP